LERKNDRGLLDEEGLAGFMKDVEKVLDWVLDFWFLVSGFLFSLLSRFTIPYLNIDR
jgi:hypothetical protein